MTAPPGLVLGLTPYHDGAEAAYGSCASLVPQRGSAMKVPLTIADHLDRAEAVYGRRTVLLDEPDQPAAPWGR